MQSRRSGAQALGNTGYVFKATALVLMAVAALLLAVPVPAAAGEDRLFGVWANPQDSVHVRIEPCGDRICGIVVWASAKAAADAAPGGRSEEHTSELQSRVKLACRILLHKSI